MNGLKKYDAVAKKQLFEQQFNESISADPAKKEKYGNLFPQFKKVYNEYKVLNKQVDYYSECLMAIEAFTYARSYNNLLTELKKKQKGLTNTYETMSAEFKKLGFYKGYNKPTDIKICEAMLTEYIKGVPSNNRPYVLDSFIVANSNDAKKMTDFLFSNTNFVDKDKSETMLNDLEKYTNLYERDPVFYITNAIVKYYSTSVFPQFQYDEREINELEKLYIQGQKEIFKDKKFYPDANSTLRVAYGKVNSYKPKDGVQYNYYTTLDGIMEKYIPKDEEFDVPEKLIDLYKKKDYGPYANKDGKLPVAFTASNHTTGGNSGSPVFNSKGELIGTNFDRNWEGTMSDIMYNPNQCRNIVLDVRYTLFVIDKFAGAGYLLDEMKLIK
ncbi:MAG: S46 family peptidase [Bacteroidetes bacterium]|nr:S46 family peptidase [Bacteroidota bacterium]